MRMTRPLLVGVAALLASAAGCQCMGKPRTLVPEDGEARAGNPFGNQVGRINSVGCGLYAWINPPPSGEHDLHIRGSADGKDVDVKYKLIVGAD